MENAQIFKRTHHTVYLCTDIIVLFTYIPVSYTHLDVYKRQHLHVLKQIHYKYNSKILHGNQHRKLKKKY